MASVYETTDDGRHICPECGDAYDPEYESKAAAKEHGSDVAKEQYITGICSQACWDNHLGLNQQ